MERTSDLARILGVVDFCGSSSLSLVGSSTTLAGLASVAGKLSPAAALPMLTTATAAVTAAKPTIAPTAAPFCIEDVSSVSCSSEREEDLLAGKDGNSSSGSASSDTEEMPLRWLPCKGDDDLLTGKGRNFSSCSASSDLNVAFLP